MFYSSFRFVSFIFHWAKAECNDHIVSKGYIRFSNSLIIHKLAKRKENHKRDGFRNVIKHLHKLAKLSSSFFPEICICLRSCIIHSQLYQTLALVSDTYTTYLYLHSYNFR